jgi:hypothetical protein
MTNESAGHESNSDTKESFQDLTLEELVSKLRTSSDESRSMSEQLINIDLVMGGTYDKDDSELYHLTKLQPEELQKMKEELEARHETNRKEQEKYDDEYKRRTGRSS